MKDIIPDQYREYGYRFLPLVIEKWTLLCNLDILFLRRDVPGGLIHAGDIDNRIKTLLDALRKPGNGEELAGNEEPQDGEDPFYCLLEDDKLITGLHVDTDTLLDSYEGDVDNRQVKLFITVDIKPYYTTTFNLSLA